MKNLLLLIIISCSLCSCFFERSLQAEIAGFTLVRIEPHWYQNNSSAYLVWADDHIPANYYETRIKLQDTAYYWIGMQMKAVLKK